MKAFNRFNPGLWVQLKLVATAALIMANSSSGSVAAGRTAWNDGNLAQAKIEFQAAVDNNPTSVEANVLLALTKLALIPADSEIKAGALMFGYELDGNPGDVGDSDAQIRRERLDAAKWSYDPTGGKDGGDAVKSGAARSFWSSALTAEIEGPGELSFSWNLSDPSPEREFGIEYLYQANAGFAIDDVDNWWRSIEPNSAETEEIYIGEGTHRVYWIFSDPTDSIDSGAALWVDQVVFTPDSGSAQFPTPQPGSLQDGIDLGITLINDGLTVRPLYDNPSGEETQTFLRDVLLPKLAEIEELLSIYTASGPAHIDLPNQLSWFEELTNREYRFDYADALYARASIQALKGVVYFLDPHDLSDVPLIWWGIRLLSDWEILETAKEQYPDFLKRRSGSDADRAVDPIDQARSLLREAKTVADARPFQEADLYFFRNQAAAGDLLYSMDNFLDPDTSIRNVVASAGFDLQIHADAYFSESLDINQLLPAVKGNQVLLGGSPGGVTFPDATFNGIATGKSDLELSNGIAGSGGIWTFDNWKHFPENSGGLTDYVFQPNAPYQSGYIAQISSTEWRFTQYGDIRPGVSDFRQLTPEFSRDMKTWEPDLPAQSSGGFTFYEGSSWWSLNYSGRFSSNGDPTSPLFMRVAAAPSGWPEDMNGWVVLLHYPDADVPVIMSFIEDGQLIWQEGDSVYTYDVSVVSEGRTVYVRFFNHRNIENLLILSREQNGYGSGKYFRMLDPSDLNSTTPWHLTDYSQDDRIVFEINVNDVSRTVSISYPRWDW